MLAAWARGGARGADQGHRGRGARRRHTHRLQRCSSATRGPGGGCTWRSGCRCSCALAAPWFVAGVACATRSFAPFFFVHEHFQRFLTTEHQRVEPWWYFLPLLLLGGAAVARCRCARAAARLAWRESRFRLHISSRCNFCYYSRRSRWCSSPSRARSSRPTSCRCSRCWRPSPARRSPRRGASCAAPRRSARRSRSSSRAAFSSTARTATAIVPQEAVDVGACRARWRRAGGRSVAGLRRDACAACWPWRALRDPRLAGAAVRVHASSRRRARRASWCRRCAPDVQSGDRALQRRAVPRDHSALSRPDPDAGRLRGRAAVRTSARSRAGPADRLAEQFARRWDAQPRCRGILRSAACGIIGGGRACPGRVIAADSYTVAVSRSVRLSAFSIPLLRRAAQRPGAARPEGRDARRPGR